ncbi:MAG: FAD-dependent oxidoreductase, partial [Rhodospirillaceae bacterium]|nr:FAD-dependent oxidoreductase [Rhodospirillaceae bacterium]
MVYVIGAGVSGLGAVSKLSKNGRNVVIFESANHPGGRCRTFYDEKLGAEIDNGNHLVLSSNKSILEMADESQLHIAERADFDFIDLKNNSSWKIDGGSGRIPWFYKKPPGASAWNLLNDYRKLNCDRAISDVLDTSSVRWHSFWLPLVLAIMNTSPDRASARLLHRVLSETILRGGHNSRPVFALNGISKAFIEPTAGRADIRYATPLKDIDTNNGKVSGLVFRDFAISLKTDDVVIMAVPWAQA